MGRRTDFAYWLWGLIARVLHPFGTHTFVDVEVWNMSNYEEVTQRIGRQCWLCDTWQE